MVPPISANANANPIRSRRNRNDYGCLRYPRQQNPEISRQPLYFPVPRDIGITLKRSVHRASQRKFQSRSSADTTSSVRARRSPKVARLRHGNDPWICLVIGKTGSERRTVEVTRLPRNGHWACSAPEASFSPFLSRSWSDGRAAQRVRADGYQLYCRVQRTISPSRDELHCSAISTLLKQVRK